MSPADEKHKKRIGDLFSLSRINTALYVCIFILAAFIIYYVIAEYMMYARSIPEEDLRVDISKNAVEQFSDGFHPLVVVEASARKPCTIDVRLESAAYSGQQSSGEHVNNYTAFFILPETAFSTEFNLTVTATAKSGMMWVDKQALATQPKPEVLFKVQ
ncbi:hypothetical protein KY359_05920 [Candidatus Woesearchaeota archaeon]|nr:hypothetical protein [Candidatus Woesearchaeota archaeon]